MFFFFLNTCPNVDSTKFLDPQALDGWALNQKGFPKIPLDI